VGWGASSLDRGVDDGRNMLPTSSYTAALSASARLLERDTKMLENVSSVTREASHAALERP
jgi:hypothetical protein